MIVVKVEMWPKGDHTRPYMVSVGSLDLVGVATRDDPTSGVQKGERAYRVRLFRDVAFGGPDGTTPLESAPLWKQGHVRGHHPGVGKRGTWDLLGGALRILLGSRIQSYAPMTEHPPPVTLSPEDPRCPLCGHTRPETP